MTSYLDSDSWHIIYHQPEKGHFFSFFTSHHMFMQVLGEERKLMIPHILIAIAFLSALGSFRMAEVLLLEVLGFSFLSLLKIVIASSTL